MASTRSLLSVVRCVRQGGGGRVQGKELRPSLKRSQVADAVSVQAYAYLFTSPSNLQDSAGEVCMCVCVCIIHKPVIYMHIHNMMWKRSHSPTSSGKRSSQHLFI